MVNSHTVGSLAARALFYMSTRPIEQRADAATYTTNTISAINTLQQWYNQQSGLWDTTGWWNSGNCLTVLGDFAVANPGQANDLQLAKVFQNTFTNAQQNVQAATKTFNSAGMVLSSYSKLSARQVQEKGFAGFINNFYDDEGWWCLGLIRVYDATQDKSYLSMAESIFEDMKAGTDTTCGGGIWWSKDKKYKNAIANELYLSAAASLANRVASKKSYYLDIANKEWTWFKNSGMINGNNLINDGLNINADGSCTNNGQNTWTYNQGVILGGLVELAQAGGDQSLLTQAATIATAAIQSLSQAGILHETCDPDCGSDGVQFKGIFMRNLHYLQKAHPQEAYQAYIKLNADTIWEKDRNTKNDTLGTQYIGPWNAGNGPNAGSQSSAMDTLVAAIVVS